MTGKNSTRMVALAVVLGLIAWDAAAWGPRARQAIATTAKPFTMYIVVGVIYLGFSTVITLSVMVLEKYANRHLEVAR